MADAVAAAARDVAVSSYGYASTTASSTHSASPSPSDAALLALKLAPDIILGAHLSGLKSGDRLTGQLVLHQQEATLLLVTERGVFAVSPKDNLPTSGTLDVQIASVGRTVQAVVQQAARQLDINLTLIALPRAPDDDFAPQLITADDARALAKIIMQEMPRLADLLRILPEQAKALADPKTSAPGPATRSSPPPAASPAAAPTIILQDADPAAPEPIRASVLTLLDRDGLTDSRSGPLAQLLTTGRAVLLRALPASGTLQFAELVQAGQPPRTVILPAGFSLANQAHAILLLERPARPDLNWHETSLSVSENRPENAPVNGSGILRHLPAPGDRFSGQLALIFNLLANNPATEILPPSAEQNMLREMISTVKNSENPADISAKITIPLRLAGELVPMQFVFYAPLENEGTQDNQPDQARAGQQAFDVSITFPKLGPVKLAGVYHRSFLSLTVHTNKSLPQALQHDLSALYAQVLMTDNWSGHLRFKTAE